MRNTIAKRYAQGLFDLAQEKGLIEEISLDCKGIQSAFEENQNLLSFLQNPKIPRDGKINLFDQALKGKVNEITYNFILLLIEKGRIQHLKSCVEEFLVLADISKGLLEVEVTSVNQLDNMQVDKLQGKLEQTTNKKVSINNKIDPSILGGLIIKIGNQIIDGSVITKINKIKESLLKAQVMEVEVRE